MDTISFVFQNSRLLKGSILDNVRLGRAQATEAEVLAALKAAQCMDIVEKFPEGIHTVIGTKGVYLSGGEQQRIAIARAMLKNAPILLLDALGVSLGLIHLVDGHDDGDPCGLGMVDGLHGLGHDAVLCSHHQNGDVRDHGAPGTHGGKGLVARGIQKGDGLSVDLDGVGADVLRDAAGLAGDDVRLADGVEQACLAVVRSYDR